MKTSITSQLVFITFGFLLCTFPNIDTLDDDTEDGIVFPNDDGISITGDISDDATGQRARISYRDFDARELSEAEDEYEEEDEDTVNVDTVEDEEPRLDIRSWGNDVPNYARKLKKSQVYECEDNECNDWCRVLLKLPEGRCDHWGKCFCLNNTLKSH